jgi:hypothetical protein
MGCSAMTDRPRKWYHNVWVVLFLLFFVIGPCGLPLVWTNPRFSRPVKWLLTGVTVLYMVSLAWLTLQMVRAVGQEMRELDQVFRF